ncbi:hypothetical protein Sipo8835_27720 [Streptomyces ipomoeae]|uniref:Uncharacterized protein n=1 Tax=Streptomyces ipomoeae TaxID=103232 RepID=A0AAE8W097_9ACTN|nr:hypothetical protein [Streptomyces ipomoeae]TQE27310.1 hypothetical protein Sipo8835_27720 [Streptomyces ipomoeae]
MLIGYPVLCRTGTPAGFAVHAAGGNQFWLNPAIALNIVGVGGALLAALPGYAARAFGIPRGPGHAGLGVAALTLFANGLNPCQAPAPAPRSLRIWSTTRATVCRTASVSVRKCQ